MSRKDPERAYLEVAVRACRAAGRIQRAAFGGAQQVEHKGEIDLVTAIDRRCEEAILALLAARLPRSRGPRRGERPAHRDAEHLWVVDPLDGTTNYSRGFPYFCVSVALARGGRVIVAAVYQPLLDELFTAMRGRGALTSTAGRCGSPAQARLDQAFLATGFPYDIRRGAPHQPRPLHQLRHPLPGDPPGGRRRSRPGLRRRRALRRFLGAQAAPVGHRRGLAVDRGGRRAGHRARRTPLAPARARHRRLERADPRGDAGASR